MKILFRGCVAALLVLSWATAQNVVCLKDAVTLQPVEDLLVRHNGTNFQPEGNCWSAPDNIGSADTVIYSAPGYKTLFAPWSGATELFLLPSGSELDVVVISANRFEMENKLQPQRIELVTKQEIQFRNPSTSADLLQQTGHVFVQRSQLGGGSPIIRGFEASRVLLVIDGVRMNNAIYRAGHLQDVITIDPYMLERSEILFGPGSVQFGSDALGGVMHFITRDPKLSTDGSTNLFGSGYVRYGTAASEMSGHMDLNLGFNNVASLTSITYSDFGDLRQGSIRSPFNSSFGKRTWYQDRINNTDTMMVNADSNLQVGSGYSQIDIMQKFLFQQSEKVSHLLSLQYSTSSNIPRYDRLVQMSSGKPRFAEWYYGPQRRMFAAYTLNVKGEGTFYDNIRVTLSYQNIDQTRYNRKFNKIYLRAQEENVKVYALNADLVKKIGERHTLSYGVEGTFNDVVSNAYQKDITTGVDTIGYETRYSDGKNTMMMISGYIMDNFKINDLVALNGGVRVNWVNLECNFVSKRYFPFPFDQIKQNNTAITGNLGAVITPGAGWRFAMGGSTGFRAPNVDDQTKLFESAPGLLIVPNSNLKPEYTYNGEITVDKYFGDAVRLEASGWYTEFANALTVGDGTYNGADSVMYDGVMSDVITMTNAVNGAYIYGASGAVWIRFNDSWSLENNLTWTYGRIRTDSVPYPLDHIPPMYGRTSLHLMTKKFHGETFVMWNGWKRLSDYNMFGEDNFAYATAVGMPSWLTLNLRASYSITQNVMLQASLENILDTNYRMFASNISAPGRNFVVTLRGFF